MIGMRIRRERIKRNWSQSGLCYGICAVSYLSKIEQGKMEVSEEILKLLLERLELLWIDDKETKDLESFVEAQYEFLFTHPIQEFLKQKEIFQEKKEKLYSSSLIADHRNLRPSHDPHVISNRHRTESLFSRRSRCACRN